MRLHFKKSGFYHGYIAVTNQICVSGFIDYIVLPTMNVLGDALDLVLSSIDPTLLRSMYTKIQEDDHSPAGSRNKILLHRPWTDILMENREKWQKKHDAGMFLYI